MQLADLSAIDDLLKKKTSMTRTSTNRTKYFTYVLVVLLKVPVPPTLVQLTVVLYIQLAETPSLSLLPIHSRTHINSSQTPFSNRRLKVSSLRRFEQLNSKLATAYLVAGLAVLLTSRSV